MPRWKLTRSLKGAWCAAKPPCRQSVASVRWWSHDTHILACGNGAMSGYHTLRRSWYTFLFTQGRGRGDGNKKIIIKPVASDCELKPLVGNKQKTPKCLYACEQVENIWIWFINNKCFSLFHTGHGGRYRLWDQSSWSNGRTASGLPGE